MTTHEPPSFLDCCCMGAVPRESNIPLLKEYTLFYNRNPNMILGIFLNSGISESLGTQPYVRLSASSVGHGGLVLAGCGAAAAGPNQTV